MHRKIVFVKVESSVIKYLKVTIDLDAVTLLGLLASESVFFGSPKNSQPNRILSTYAIRKNYCSTLERYGRVRIEIKHLYPCLSHNKLWVLTFWGV